MRTLRWEPESQEVWDEAFAEATSINDLAGRLGITKDTVRAYARRTGIDLTPVKERVAGTAARFATVQEQVTHELRVQRLEDRIRELERLYVTAKREANLFEDIVAEWRAVAQPLPVPEIVAPAVEACDLEEDAILGWADWHFGEVIDYDVMLGYNSYDPIIACRRAQYTVDDTIDLLLNRHRGTRFERLYVFDLGDSISGDHLPELLASNAAGVFRSIRMVAMVKAVALQELSAHFPVTYVAVPGNHGRRSVKMQWKDPTETADWLIAEQLRDLCADNERVTIVVPQAWSVGVEIRGWNHMLDHGYASSKGGYGGIPWYAFMRSDGKMTAIEAAHGMRVHHRWYGHIHQKAEIPMMDGAGEQHIIGSLKGGDEYALAELKAYADPVQKLVGCHEKHGVTWRYPLNVKSADERPSRYERLIAPYMPGGSV